MKKKILLVLCLLILCGCSIYNTPTNIVKIFLSRYINMDEEVLTDMEITLIDEELSDENMELYKKVLERQYKEIEYEILDEQINNNNATVKVKLNVYDYNKAINDSITYMNNHLEEFSDENSIFDNDKYTKYKLDNMNTIEDRISYEVVFELKKKDGEWNISNPNREVLEKIHGIYEKKY